MDAQPEAVSTTIAALLGFIGVLAFMGVRSPEERRFLLPLGIAAFLLRVILVPLYYYALVQDGLGGYAYIDAFEYHLDGIELAGEFASGLTYKSRAWGIVDPGFSFVTGILYWIAGPNTLVVRMLNAMVGTFTLLYVYRTTRLFFDEERVARIAALLAAFLPFSIVIAINHRKEPIVTLLSVYIFMHATRMLRFEPKWGSSAFLAFAGLATIAFFRSGFVFPFLAILFLCYITTTQSLLRSISLALPTIVLFAVVQFLISDDGSLSLAASNARIEGKLQESAGLAEVGGLVRYVRMTSIFEIYKLPFATVLMVILPFPPYLSGSLPSLLLSWTNLVNLFFLPHMISGALHVLRSKDWRKQLPVLLFPGIFLVLLGATHVGVIRYRETVFPIMLVVAAIGIHAGTSLVMRGLTYFGLLGLGGLVYFARFG